MPLNENMKPEPETEAQALVKNFQEILKIPAVRKAVISGKVIERPSGWRASANAPYFRERFAREFQSALDVMMETQQDMEYKFHDFKMTKDSLYLRVHQSKMYLLERLDPEGKYRDFMEQITITREKTGIRLSFNRDVLLRTDESYKGFMPSPVMQKEEQVSFIRKVGDWLTEAEVGDVYEANKLSISEEEIKELKIILAPLENIAADITHNRIKLVRME